MGDDDVGASIPPSDGTVGREMASAQLPQQAQDGRAARLQLPNLLLLGVQKSGSSAIAHWLRDAGVCRPKSFAKEPAFYRKEAHFFDHNDRYHRGIEFYAKRFKHCNKAQVIMDATPNYFIHPERVHSMYSDDKADDALSNLKLVVTLREPVSRELSRYNHQVSKMKRKNETGDWYSDVVFTNYTIMNFDQFVENVLKDQLLNPTRSTTGKYVDHLKKWSDLFGRERILVLSYDELRHRPHEVKWRIERFLGRQLPGEIGESNTKESKSKAKTVSSVARRILEEIFEEKNRELYEFLDDHRGPSMEAYPFPRFATTNEKR